MEPPCNDTVVSEGPQADEPLAMPRTIGWSRPGADDGEGRFLTFGPGAGHSCGHSAGFSPASLFTLPPPSTA
jgi:hypothetical protein